jgi:hypothetical protein
MYSYSYTSLPVHVIIFVLIFVLILILIHVLIYEVISYKYSVQLKIMRRVKSGGKKVELIPPPPHTHQTRYM